MVPRLRSSSSASMPMPLSETVRVRSDAFAAIWIFHSGESAAIDLSVRARNLARSMASEALDTSSRRNISFFE